jgi:hypothetical protein
MTEQNEQSQTQRNPRLIEAYSQLESQSNNDFLENRIDLDTMWGKEIFGVCLQVDLSQPVQDVVVGFQHALEQLEPGNFLFPPRESQHVSVDQVVFWNGDYARGGQATWDAMQSDFVERMHRLDDVEKPFEIVFSKLIATKNAIVLAAYDQTDEFQQLRERLHHELPFPEETTKLNDIIHTTVARFKNQLDNPQAIMDYLHSRHSKIAMTVSQIILRNELVFPSLRTKDISTLSL